MYRLSIFSIGTNWLLSWGEYPSKGAARRDVAHILRSAHKAGVVEVRVPGEEWYIFAGNTDGSEDKRVLLLPC